MKTNVAETSIAAHHSMRGAGDLPVKEAAVYLAIALCGPMTREQIAARTGMKEGSVCGRVNKLLERGRLVETGFVVNQTTKKLNKVVDLLAADRARFLRRA
jgi:DNA-binding MarR family transcriptional regulator